jgi:hypothetical protein
LSPIERQTKIRRFIRRFIHIKFTRLWLTNVVVSFDWKMNSSSSSEDEGDLHWLTINEHFAKAFQYRKEREELVKRTHYLVQ